MNIQSFLENKEAELSSSTKHTPFVAGWKSDFPNYGGVYVLWKGDSPIYVGETSGIFSRMSDLMRPVNHAFTKKISIETNIKDLKLLRKYISTNYTLSYITVDIGRSEIEEYLILRWRNTLINKPTTRLLEGTQYSWVQAM